MDERSFCAGVFAFFPFRGDDRFENGGEREEGRWWWWGLFPRAVPGLMVHSLLYVSYLLQPVSGYGDM